MSYWLEKKRARNAMIVLELHNMCTKKYMYQRALRTEMEITSQLLEVLPIVRATLVGRFCKGLFIQRHDEEIRYEKTTPLHRDRRVRYSQQIENI